MENIEDNDLTAEDLKKIKKSEEKDEVKHERLKAKLYEQEQMLKRLQKENEELKEAKRKPGITNINEDNIEKKKRPNSFGLSDFVLPPYIRNRVAVYQILNIDGVNPATGLKVERYDVAIPGRFIFHDKFEKDPNKMKKIIKNVVSTEEKIIGGKSETVEVIDDIIFERGIKQVPIWENYPLHVMLELHPGNINNKFRQSNAVGLFERLDINQKSALSRSATMDLVRDAMIDINKLDDDSIRAYAAAAKEIDVTSKRLLHDIRTDLTRWAMDKPVEYFKLNKDTKAAIHINILDAIQAGLVDYVADQRGYVYMETDEVICTHSASENPMDRMVKFLSSKDGKGQEWYEVIMKRMKYWE